MPKQWFASQSVISWYVKYIRSKSSLLALDHLLQSVLNIFSNKSLFCHIEDSLSHGVWKVVLDYFVLACTENLGNWFYGIAPHCLHLGSRILKCPFLTFWLHYRYYFYSWSSGYYFRLEFRYYIWLHFRILLPVALPVLLPVALPVLIPVAPLGATSGCTPSIISGSTSGYYFKVKRV